MAEFGRSKQAWFHTFLDLPNGIPSHDTFWRVFRALDPDHFQTSFLNWIRATSPLIKGQVIAIDGKQLRRSHDKGLGRSAIYMVSAWATANHLVLGQRKVAEKSNEITAIPELLRALDLAGCLVTIDAIGCQTAIAQLIIEQNADYLLALKANQGQLYDDVAFLFADLTASQYQAYPHDHANMRSKGHGRLESRQAWTISDPQVIRHLRHANQFAHLTTVMMVRLERRCGADVSVETRYYISSTPYQRCPAAAQQTAALAHRELPTLDPGYRAFGRMNHACARIMAPKTSPSCATSPSICFKQETTCKLGVFNKRLKAAWDT